MTDLFDLTDRVAIVSGTASGMGQAMATAFAEAGAHLVLLDLNTAGNEETAHALTQLGQRALPMTCDVSSYEQLDQVYALVDREFGRVDILGNVAGNGIQKAAEEISMAEFQRVFQSLVFGRYYSTQQAGQRMLRQGKGSIISIGSISGITSLARQQSAYGMAMAAVIHMTRELSTEWSGRGVRVNAILPAQVLSKNNGLAARMEREPVLRDTFLHGIPIGRFGRSEDIKGLALWLASDASSWITGTIIPMDGGNLAMNAGGGLIGQTGHNLAV
ncbi:MAG: SDR family oxidoreductase [Caldilineaceae bacterium]|nr:SDR family oxidoreductase [Caldilineaceae bacterium]MBP8123075.1 SDR family oxidoreductase [Caldilineaceae bacterium]MBP9073387.1 SDR family oxidoreductase [Caldilineaceae bacterium]